MAFTTVLSYCGEVLDARSLRIRGGLDSCITATFKNSQNSVSLLPMPFALNCMMVNELSWTACVGIGGGCSFGRVGGELQELQTQSLIRLYSAAC